MNLTLNQEMDRHCFLKCTQRDAAAVRSFSQLRGVSTASTISNT
jgi:hypothetical protein